MPSWLGPPPPLGIPRTFLIRDIHHIYWAVGAFSDSMCIAHAKPGGYHKSLARDISDAQVCEGILIPPHVCRVLGALAWFL